MIIAKTVQELQAGLPKDRKISFVPTMGFLHEGHKSLIEHARRESEFVVVSIFVNPAQFNDPSDYQNYPVDLKKDEEICRLAGVDLIFEPGPSVVYPDGVPDIKLTIPNLMNNLCATTRPGHFEGVLLVLSRLFHWVRPAVAYFGKKDYQQYLIVKTFCQNLCFPLEIQGVETIREEDGLAKSSRNARLNDSGRKKAASIYKSLLLAKQKILEGTTDPDSIRKDCQDVILAEPDTQIDYYEIVNPKDLSPWQASDNTALVAVAAFVDGVRLIDNILVEPT